MTHSFIGTAGRTAVPMLVFAFAPLVAKVFVQKVKFSGVRDRMNLI